MAEKKTTRKPKAKKPEAEKVTYRGQIYDVLEQNEHQYKLTDGIIYFWVKAAEINGEH